MSSFISDSRGTRLRLIAFYLPQFHPIPENDAWWGKGFTEWTNVAKAEPLFAEHYQPHRPSDFGYYDLRVKETRHDQIRAAKEYGIDGFCYHYYWFSGKRLLNKPLDDMLEDTSSDMPFCLCWANENWTRRWDAAEHEVLLAQRYLPDDYVNFIRSAEPFLRDKRYIRVNGKPLLIIYRPQHLPDAKQAAEIWRDYCLKVGIGDIQICSALTHGNKDYTQFGFDAGVEFPPHNIVPPWLNEAVAFDEPFEGLICDYKDVANQYLAESYPGKVYRTVLPSWDNTARRKHRSLVILNGTPQNYEYWLSSTIDRVLDAADAVDELIFINAWNEWAEGCHLEPDVRYGHSFLEATQSAKNGRRRYSSFANVGPPTPKLPASFRTDIISLVRTHSKLNKRRLRKLLSQRQRLHTSLRLLSRPWRKIRFLIQSKSDSILRKNPACFNIANVAINLTPPMSPEVCSQMTEPHSTDSNADFIAYDNNLREDYLNLVHATLAGLIYEDPPLEANTNDNKEYDPVLREYGWDWPSKAFTMVGSKRLNNFRQLIENAIAYKVPGDIVETGVWRGGACIMAKAVLKVYGQKDRQVLLCDSFEGLPPPDEENFPGDSGSTFHLYPDLAVSLETVEENFRRFNLLDDQVVFIKGFFKDTLPTLPCRQIAVLRLDGDMYESTIIALRHLYDKVSPRGWVIIDDYEVVPACKQAVHDFLNERQLDPVLHQIDGVGRYFQKT
jgi:hypothetical protein